MSDSETDESKPTQLILARWSDRFFAWLIDLVIINSVVFTVYLGLFSANFYQVMSGDFEASRFFEHGPLSIVFFLYWLILESKTGQSIGKRALHLKITDLSGKPANFKSIVISSFGKAFPFLLPIDVIVGRLIHNKKRQRIFNKLGKTIVIKVEDDNEDDDEPENVVYKKD
jgi:uncharacterized RDD family membrane protein YckC